MRQNTFFAGGFSRSYLKRINRELEEYIRTYSDASAAFSKRSVDVDKLGGDLERLEALKALRNVGFSEKDIEDVNKAILQLDLRYKLFGSRSHVKSGISVGVMPKSSGEKTKKSAGFTPDYDAMKRFTEFEDVENWARNYIKTGYGIF